MKKTFATIITVIMLCLTFAVSAFATDGVDYDIYKCDINEEHAHSRDCLTENAEADLKIVEELLNVPTIQEIQNARGTTYAKSKFENDQSAAAAAYDAYVEESFIARATAQQAYDALPSELKGYISDELLSRLNGPDTVLNTVTSEITRGTNEYTFQSVYSPAYEMSSHMVSSDGGASNSIPQTLLLVDATEDYTWSPSGKYSFASSNYEVLYCCDYDTGYVGGIHYKRMNLEESDYYDEDAAAKIRAIITNSYPYVSLDQMKQNLAENGFEGAEELTRAEVISAVQVAVWSYANDASELKYSQTFDVSKNPQWGTVLHDYSSELTEWWEVGKRKFYVNDEVEDRVNRLIDYLRDQTAIYADKNQVIISDIEILSSAPVQEKEGLYKVSMGVQLNNSGSSLLDEIYIYAYVDGVEILCKKVELGVENYTLVLEVENGKEITAIVKGKQTLPEGVYFYQPEGGRDISQSLVGVAKGETQVYSEDSVTVEVEETEVYGNLVLLKTDENGLPLTGSEFMLYVNGTNGMLPVESYTVDDAGKLSITNLLPGNYQLVETKAAEGYYMLEEEICFTVMAENGSCVIVSGPTGVEITETDGTSFMTVVNKRIPTINDKITVEGSKTWVDEGYEDKRPESVTVQVMDADTEVASKVVTALDGWKWSFELPKYREDMTEIEYSIKEDEVPGYITVYEGYNIINKYLVDTDVPEDPGGGVPGEPGGGSLDPGGSPPTSPESPQTGDSPVLLLVMMTVLSAIIIFTVLKRRRQITE